MRNAIVSGQFYSSNKEELKRELNNFLNVKKEFNAKAIIVPHAGYFFSGKCAGMGFKQLGKYDTFLILGVNHNGNETCISLEDFETPLGVVKTIKKDFGIPINEKVHEMEHSIEVELPFLQILYKDFKIIPIIVGDDYKKYIKKIKEIAKKKNVGIICSGDFTHYGPSYGYVPFNENVKENLMKLDNGAIEFILKRDVDGFNKYLEKTGATICGRLTISLLLNIINKNGKLLGYYNSGDIVKDYKNVVGYAAICF